MASQTCRLPLRLLWWHPVARAGAVSLVASAGVRRKRHRRESNRTYELRNTLYNYRETQSQSAGASKRKSGKSHRASCTSAMHTRGASSHSAKRLHCVRMVKLNMHIYCVAAAGFNTLARNRSSQKSSPSRSFLLCEILDSRILLKSSSCVICPAACC